MCSQPSAASPAGASSRRCSRAARCPASSPRTSRATSRSSRSRSARSAPAWAAAASCSSTTRACVVDLNVMFSWFLEDESCGRCTTCRGGNQRMIEIFRRVVARRRRGRGPRRASSRSATSMQYSNCFHGTLSPVIISNTLTHFQDEYDAHVSRAPLPGEGLRRADPLPRRPTRRAAVAEAADICPTEAIVADAAAPGAIDDEKCVRCNACRDVAPGDIAIEDRFKDVIPLRTLVPADVARSRLASPTSRSRLPTISRCPRR